MSGPDWVMVHQTSGRRDVRMYAPLGAALVFVYAGATINRATNGSSGGECAPWLVPVAFWVGVAATLVGAAALLRNPRHVSRINQRTDALMWWDETHSPDVRSVKLADVAVIRIDQSSATSTVQLSDLCGELLPLAGSEVAPWPYPKWAHGIAKLYSHIRMEAA